MIRIELVLIACSSESTQRKRSSLIPQAYTLKVDSSLQLWEEFMTAQLLQGPSQNHINKTLCILEKNLHEDVEKGKEP